MADVPNRCAANISVIISKVTGMTGGSGMMADSPSIEVVTVIAGVITPSGNQRGCPERGQQVKPLLAF